MPGLIPLMLNSTSSRDRSSIFYFPDTPKKVHTRGQSLGLPAATQPPASPQSPRFASALKRSSVPVAPKPKAAKRLSFVLPNSIPVLPLTAADWRRTIAEIKRHHISHRYRACFARCDEILSTIKDTSNVEPVYLISLHFYAATSKEMCARPLLAPSASRERLFRQAQEHYDKAAVLVNNAEEAVFCRSRPSSVMSSASSLHSPSGSVSSRTWTSETDMSSPTPSICSSDDLNTRSRQSSDASSDATTILSRPARKKVSFELPKPEEVVPKFEPYIRPDSPTLGFDDAYFTGALARTELPELPERVKTPEPEQDVDMSETTPKAFPRSPFEQASFDIRDDHIRDSFLMGGSTSRYISHLSSLKSQISLHQDSLQLILEDPVADARPAETSEEMRSLERKARIERLRMNGWQRKRFDSSRYEALCSAALAEL